MTPYGSDRESFLARVRQAVLLGRTYRVAVKPVPDSAAYVGCPEDRCAAMAKEVTEVGGRAHIANDDEQARRILGQILRAVEPRIALCWRHPLLDRLQLGSILHSMGIQSFDFEQLAKMDDDQRRRVVLSADLGITSATLAIAETGSLVMQARPGSERLASLLPVVHLAIISESQIVPDLFDAIADLDPVDRSAPLPSNVTIITGPSKTGDIELQLTTGVHGPGYWHVLIIREPHLNSTST